MGRVAQTVKPYQGLLVLLVFRDEADVLRMSVMLDRVVPLLRGLDVVTLLIAATALRHEKISAGTTLLMIAAEEGYSETVDLLINHGCDHKQGLQ